MRVKSRWSYFKLKISIAAPLGVDFYILKIEFFKLNSYWQFHEKNRCCIISLRLHALSVSSSSPLRRSYRRVRDSRAAYLHNYTEPTWEKRVKRDSHSLEAGQCVWCLHLMPCAGKRRWLPRETFFHWRQADKFGDARPKDLPALIRRQSVMDACECLWGNKKKGVFFFELSDLR